MKIVNHIPIFLMVLSLSTNAEVFKCKQASGKIIYQSEPCSSDEIPQGVVKVKPMTVEETEAAKAKLKAWQEEQAISEAAKIEAEKEKQVELERQESLELQRRSVMAQEQQAIAAQQRQNRGGGVFFPPYGYNGRHWNNQPYPPFNGWQPYNQRQDTWQPNMFPQHVPQGQWDSHLPPPQPIAPPPSPGLVPGSPPQNGNKSGLGFIQYHQ